ncbi:YrdB family protein [Streptomyces sp. NBC_00249]|uniref:YrdB family protein n=1 Tax=Streptomyces sp. NBC_00249 TaxID=2975690 RepID=UPI0022545A99|nr:YrdB family protein [Streptomyces sp. NBC_00249]MCX5196708.1 YrdB family protein [Streptomyces sp. NBC_00249]
MNSTLRFFFIVNEGLAFLLELGALAALARWGWTRDIGRVWSIGLAVAAPVAAGVLWGAFAAPKATYAVPLVAQLAVKAVVFGAATLALYAVGWRAGALWFGGIVLVNTALATYYRTRG